MRGEPRHDPVAVIIMVMISIGDIISVMIRIETSPFLSSSKLYFKEGRPGQVPEIAKRSPFSLSVSMRVSGEAICHPC